MKRFDLFLPQPLLDKLKVLAAKLDTSISEIIRQAIDYYLERKNHG